MTQGRGKLGLKTLEEDYGSAARRHLHDARTLLAAERLDNAAYLAGYVVECALKRLLEIHGHGAREYGHDLRRLSGQALVLAAILSPGATRYRFDDIPLLPQMVSVWRPDLRYLPTGAVVDGDLMVTGAAEVYERVMVEAILDGSGALNP
ncbi:MAG: HEPN domain-containing protein [Myxococcaceae bacterium]|nr:HEPN domain-containing protein [Myxococcaceae bacterium]